KPNPQISSYAAFTNSPLLFRDVLGDTTYRFSNADGSYLGMFDTDAPGQRGSYGEYKTLGEGKNKQQMWNGQLFHVADPINDSKDIKDGIINKLIFVSDAEIKEILEAQGAFNYKDQDNPYKFYQNSTGGRKFDYSFSVIPKKYGPQGAPNNPLKTKSPLLF